ncbi:hypothetical protein [Sorangium sp. So ce341]|uniref:hypothetical protein n=1 Tax=Sorangium sp. So ce341 TaxID=3133302 RepID=UPI003F5DD5DB
MRTPSRSRGARASFAGVALVAAAVAAARPSWAHDGPRVTAASPNEPVRLCDDGLHPTYTFPVDLAPGISAEQRPTARVVGVVRDRLQETEQLREAFELTLDAAGSGSVGPALGVKVDFSRVKRPGTYEVSIELASRDGSVRQGLVIGFTRPRAALHAREPLIFRQSFGDQEVILQLEERSGCSPIKALAVEASEGSDERGEAGYLEFPSQPREIAAGGAATMRVLLKSFPFGTAKGTIRLRADQLGDEALTLNYEVRKRLPGWVILLLVSGGCLAGWIFRHVLQRRAERLQHEVQVGRILARIEREMKGLSVVPPGELDQLREASLDLSAKLKSNDPQLPEAMKRAEDALVAALEIRARVREKKLVELTGLLAPFDISWLLPPSVSARAADARRLLGEVQERWSRCEFDGLQAVQEAAGRALVDLAAEGRAWAERLDAQIDVLLSKKLPVPPGLAEKLSASAASARAALAAIPASDPAAPAAEGPLRAAHDANRLAHEMVSRLESGLRKEVEDLVDELATAHSAEERAAAVRGALEGLPAADSADVEARLAALTSALRRYDQAAQEAAKALLREAATEQNEVRAALEARNYGGALRSARMTGGPLPISGFLEMAGALEAQGQQKNAADSSARPEPPLTPAPGAPLSRHVFFFGGEYAPLAERTQAAQASLDRTNILVAVVSTILLSVGAYVAHRKEFVGTDPELLTLLALGFGTNLTVESTAQLLFPKKG